mmetsp:Transcript_113093/g.314817  ORF Transcript_113093/g.314817 Transcript_113093/m.314817 type:complete len:331 (+) Transcript_113093:140-1132(+)
MRGAIMESGSLYGTKTAYSTGYGYGGTMFGDHVADDESASYKRKRLNGWALLQCIVVPWGIFVGVLWVMSFSVHYDHVEATYFLVACGLAISPGFVLKWYWLRRDAVVAELYSWYFYLAAASLVAWLAGLVLGNANFSGNMRPYYDLTSMGLSQGVDPRDIPGDQYLDASRVIFKMGSHVEQDLALGYKDTHTYCVAPIAWGNGSNAPMAAYDYWAAGVDCCVPVPPASFWCGSDVFDPEARAALRWTSSQEIPKFRSAVEMAEAEYGIKASKPIFFSWTKDPVAETQQYRIAGVRFFHTCIWVYLVLQVMCFCTLAGCYWRMHASGKLP